MIRSVVGASAIEYMPCRMRLSRFGPVQGGTLGSAVDRASSFLGSPTGCIAQASSHVPGCGERWKEEAQTTERVESSGASLTRKQGSQTTVAEAFTQAADAQAWPGSVTASETRISRTPRAWVSLRREPFTTLLPRGAENSMSGRRFPPTQLGQAMNRGESLPVQRPAYANPPHIGAPQWWLDLQAEVGAPVEGADHLRAINQELF